MYKKESLVTALVLHIQCFASAQNMTKLSDRSLTAIHDSWSMTREEHACYADGIFCEDPDFYYNWLACQCMAKDPTCENSSCPEGWSNTPFELCGECLPDPMIRSLYPEWATEDEISASQEIGIWRVEDRPSDWRVCYEEETPEQCRDDQYWNELACECMSNVPCWSICSPGSMLDPVEDCGAASCARQSEIYANHYPVWANPMDVENAEIEGKSKRQSELWNRHRVCPLIFDEAYPCEAGQYWNELSCQCHTVTLCLMLCGEDEDFHPLKQCECENIDVIKQEVYPEWATQLDIDNAEQEGLMHYWPAPEPEPTPWPECNPTPMCSMDTYFNPLACTCWPFASYCLLGCEDGTKRDPRSDGCECISDSEFEGLFPEGASELDIELSMLDQWPYPEPEPCPEPWEEPEKQIEVPEHWPQCEPTDECDASDMNLLACECFSRVNCYRYCVDGVLHPTNWCECISRDEYRLFFPDWASDEDISISEQLFNEGY